jgi:nitrite reductase/ring-hydroxylating ferredoxin subunit
MKKQLTNTKNQMGQLSIERREFLKKAGGFAIMGLFGTSFFTSCSDDTEDPINVDANSEGINIDGDTITIDLNIIEELNTSGGWLLITQAQTLVVNDGEIKALTSVCTHSNCDRNWSLSNGNFRCSCHGSVFTTDGEVITGPATQPLTQFNVSIDDKIVTIKK